MSEFFRGSDLLQWKVAHGLSPRLEPAGLVIHDTATWDWHLLRLDHAASFLRLATVRLRVRPLQSQDANIYIHHYGDIDVAEIAPDGTVLEHGISQSIKVQRSDDGALAIEVSFLNQHPTLSIGTSRGAARYQGSGRDQYLIEWIEVDVTDAAALFDAVPDEERLQLVDVGGAGGVQLKWMLHATHISPVLFEPNPVEAEKLRRMVSRYRGGMVVESGLAAVKGSQTLNITQFWGCSSLREPNASVLSRYNIAPLFQVERQVQVECTRYDLLHKEGIVPVPDVIKIDVQGYEYEVLVGFGGLLQECLGIELEAHFYPIYRDQKLLNDLVRYLDEYGLALRDIRPVPNFDNDIVEVDAFFTRRAEAVRRLDPIRRRKFDVLTTVWGLSAVK